MYVALKNIPAYKLKEHAYLHVALQNIPALRLKNMHSCTWR